ncbi:hypothetical protein CYMTET_36691 [Cymbomonas tetramitiformis]|uniref:Uncharacterized protein n=1 Tax=Cymbomonas tetramitiformis TaxID=36881 RepID=A0AAE0F6Z6_9CHLO|nr:hypothetical protein CYMTET_36691 [Cymbomonas tetramitiformis]
MFGPVNILSEGDYVFFTEHAPTEFESCESGHFLKSLQLVDVEFEKTAGCHEEADDHDDHAHEDADGHDDHAHEEADGHDDHAHEEEADGHDRLHDHDDHAYEEADGHDIICLRKETRQISPIGWDNHIDHAPRGEQITTLTMPARRQMTTMSWMTTMIMPHEEEAE